MTITDVARNEFKRLLEKEPGKTPRVVFEGFG